MSINANQKLKTAIETGDRDLLTEALDQGAEVNKWTTAYETPLIMALKTKNCDWLSQELLKHGADINITDKNGNDAYFWLWSGHSMGNQRQAMEARMRTIELFSTRGAWREYLAPENYQPRGIENRWTVLHMAVANNFTQGIKFLLFQKNMKFDVIDTQGRQPIHLSIYNSPEAAGVLLAHGDSMDATDGKGKNVQQLVEQVHKEQSYEWLTRARKAEMEEKFPVAEGKPSDNHVMRL